MHVCCLFVLVVPYILSNILVNTPELPKMTAVIEKTATRTVHDVTRVHE